MKKLTVEKEIINPLVVIATKQLGKTNDEIGREIGKSPMIFSQIKSQRNLAGFETLALMRKKYGLNINAIVDEDVTNLFDEYNFDKILEELERVKRERDEIRIERDFFKNYAMTGKKFKDVSTQAKLDLRVSSNIINMQDDFALMAVGNFDKNIHGFA